MPGLLVLLRYNPVMSHSVLNRCPQLFFGLYLGCILSGITLIGLLVLCPPPTKNYLWVSFTDTVKPPAIEKITSDTLARGHRYLGRDGNDLIWGFNPRNIYQRDVMIPFGLFLVPVLVCCLTMLVYVAVQRCRYLFSGYSPPHTSPVPSETSGTTPR